MRHVLGRSEEGCSPPLGRGNLDALSVLMPSIQRPHLEHGANRPKMLLPQHNGCSGALAQTSRVLPVLQRCQSPTTGLMERNHPGQAGTLGIVMLFEGISP